MSHHFCHQLVTGRYVSAHLANFGIAQFGSALPQRYLRSVLERLPNQPANRIDELLPHQVVFDHLSAENFIQLYGLGRPSRRVYRTLSMNYKRFDVQPPTKNETKANNQAGSQPLFGS
jgi:hypothetical protein